MLEITLDPGVEGRLRVGLAWFSGVEASEINPHWDGMRKLGDTLRQRFGSLAPGEIPGLDPARRLYRAFGVDPTRTRPSSEALLRRVLKGLDLFQVNRVVDAGNWASLAMLLPVGLYDLDSIEGAVTVRAGHEGEGYAGIGKDHVNVSGRPVMADAQGAFGSPTSDSYRTRIRPETTRVLAAVFAPHDLADVEMGEGLDRLAGRIVQWAGGEEHGRWMLGGLG